MDIPQIQDKALYTRDDLRENLHDLDSSKLGTSFVDRVKNQAQSIACLVPKSFLTVSPTSGWQLTNVPALAKKIEEQMEQQAIFGENEAFRDELAPGFGTAFLVGRRLVLTAAHCVCNEDSDSLNPAKIKITRLIFGFQTAKNKQSTYCFEEKDVYCIKKVISHSFQRKKDRLGNYKEWTDWALLKLDREVEGRSPLPINFSGKVANRIQLYMLGHPSGLPMKFTKDGSVQQDEHVDFFTCDLDAFGGNSGSPIFNKETGKVVGMLCSGGDDYKITNNYRGTGQRRIQAHRVTQREIGNQGYEVCQRMSVLRFLVDHLDPLERPPSSPTMIIDSLKENYKSKDCISRLLHGPVPIDQIYTQLVLIQKEKEEKKAEQKAYKERRVNSWEDIHAQKIPIELPKLFDKAEGRQPKKILILGRAGIGKSTLCQYIAYQWAYDKLWKDKFDAIFWVPLRRLQSSHQGETASTFLFRLCCQESSQELYSPQIQEYIQKNQNRILFILDGLDEVTLTENSLQKKIVDELLEYPYWIITSRPHAAQSVKADCTIENVGFASKTIDLYIKKTFPKNPQTMIRKIRQNPIIFGLCHIPINLELICSILQNSRGDISAIKSMTGLYEELTLTLQRRFLEQLGKLNPWMWQKGDIDNSEVGSLFELLESIAWIGFKEGQLLFSFARGQMVKLYCQYPPSDEREQFFSQICQTGFIQSTGESAEFLKNEYYFLHLTFQEFFAARYLVRLFQQETTHLEAAKLMREVKFDPRYKVIIWFIAGLLKDDPENLNAFFDILDTPKDIIGLYSALLKVRCLEECDWSDRIKHLKQYEQEIQRWCNLIQSEDFHHWILKFLVETFEISPQGTKRLLMPLLNSCLANKNVDMKEKAVDLLAKVGQAEPQLVFPLLARALKDKDIRVRWSAVKALGQIGRTDPQFVLPLLAQALKDKDIVVRGSAAEALGQIGQADPQFVLPLLEQALRNENSDVRRLAVIALEQIGQADPQFALPLLAQALTYKDTVVRGSVAEALGKIGQADPQFALPLLEQAIKDENSDVRGSAAEALGKIGQADPQFALPLLEQAIKDENSGVRKSAVSALGQIGQADPQFVHPLLAQAIKDENSGVRKSAVSALGQIGQADPQFVHPLLAQALNDEDEFVRRLAVSVLGQIWQANPQFILPLLAQALKDEQEWIRNSATKALWQIGQADPQFVLPLLAQVLKDKDIRVRRLAVSALRQIGQVKPKSALFLLAQAIKDENSWVRGSAAEALRQIGQTDPQFALSLFVQDLKDEDSDVRRLAVTALEQIGQADPQFVLPLLIQALKDRDWQVKQLAAKVLVQIGQVDTQFVLPLLAQAIKDEDNGVRSSAAGALGQIGQADPQFVLPLLAQALNDEASDVRGSAIKAFWHYDLSSYLQQDQVFLGYYYSDWRSFTLFKTTPLNSLVNQCQEANPAYFTYLTAIVMKCLEENQAIFFENVSLCFHEQGRIFRLNFSGAELRVFQIEQFAYAYPKFLREKIILKEFASVKNSQAPQKLPVGLISCPSPGILPFPVKSNSILTTDFNSIPFFKEKAGTFSDKEIAQHLWLNPEVLISDDMTKKVNKVAMYLKEQGFELQGIKADGNCFCNAFLESYQTLPKKIPILDSQNNKIFYLRELIASKYDTIQNRNEKTSTIRVQEIKQDKEWLTADEGDLLAEALTIPIRIVTVNIDGDGCGISDMLTFAEKNKSRQKWKKVPEPEKLKQYIFIVDLGGHFVYAKPVLSKKNMEFPESKTSVLLTTPNFKNLFLIKGNKLLLEAYDLEKRKANKDEIIKNLIQAKESYIQAQNRNPNNQEIEKKLAETRWKLGKVHFERESTLYIPCEEDQQDLLIELLLEGDPDIETLLGEISYRQSQEKKSLVDYFFLGCAHEIWTENKIFASQCYFALAKAYLERIQVPKQTDTLFVVRACLEKAKALDRIHAINQEFQIIEKDVATKEEAIYQEFQACLKKIKEKSADQTSKPTCFILYDKDRKTEKWINTYLFKDLELVGANPIFDEKNSPLHIPNFRFVADNIQKNIKNGHFIFPICTPHLAKEYQDLFSKGAFDIGLLHQSSLGAADKQVIPILLEGDIQSSVMPLGFVKGAEGEGCINVVGLDNYYKNGLQAFGIIKGIIQENNTNGIEFIQQLQNHFFERKREIEKGNFSSLAPAISIDPFSKPAGLPPPEIQL